MSAFFRCQYNFHKNIRWDWKNSATSFLLVLATLSRCFLSLLCVWSPLRDAGVWAKPHPTVLDLSPLAYLGPWWLPRHLPKANAQPAPEARPITPLIELDEWREHSSPQGKQSSLIESFLFYFSLGGWETAAQNRTRAKLEPVERCFLLQD